MLGEGRRFLMALAGLAAIFTVLQAGAYFGALYASYAHQEERRAGAPPEKSTGASHQFDRCIKLGIRQEMTCCKK